MHASRNDCLKTTQWAAARKSNQTYPTLTGKTHSPVCQCQKMAKSFTLVQKHEIWHKNSLWHIIKILIQSQPEKSPERLFWGKTIIFRNIFLKNFLFLLETYYLGCFYIIAWDFYGKGEKLHKTYASCSFGAKNGFSEIYF